MTIITALILGILIGWLIEWVIDWVYWRRKAAGPVEKDALELISGIGPKIKEKLYAGGVYTFEQLAALSQADMEKIIGKEIKNLADEEELIRQAKEFAQGKKYARRGS